MSDTIGNGSRRIIGNRLRVHYDGYWVKAYEPPDDTLTAKKTLIEALTRRLFNHVEHGINIPGKRLDEARRAYETETEPARKRVKGAMLAGALFNRATDIFTKLVELQALGVHIAPDNALMGECGQCLLEALELGRLVRHRSGEEEAIDELWGEPFKAFSVPVEDFYESRYIKIAQTMRDIDRVADALVRAFAGSSFFSDPGARITDFAEAAKLKCETLRTDPEIFDVWPRFAVAGDRLCSGGPKLPPAPNRADLREAAEGAQLLEDGKSLVIHIARARVPMPGSTAELLERCEQYLLFRERRAAHDPSRAA